MIGKGASKMRGFGRGASDSVPIAPVGEPGSLVPHSGVADDLPPGFVMDEAPTVGQAAARPRDTLDIPPGPAGPLPIPSLGERVPSAPTMGGDLGRSRNRSEEHTSELQSLMRTSYAVFCLKKKKKKHNTNNN